MYLLIDIGNTRIKWQYRDEKNVISSNSVLVENFMDIDLTEIKSLKKVIVSNVNHSVVLDKVKENLSHFDCLIIEVTSESNEYLINDYEKAENFLKRAVELMPEDPIVNDHYGDILWKLDRKIQARYFWNNVLNLEETEDEMKKNIDQLRSLLLEE